MVLTNMACLTRRRNIFRWNKSSKPAGHADDRPRRAVAHARARGGGPARADRAGRRRRASEEHRFAPARRARAPGPRAAARPPRQLRPGPVMLRFAHRGSRAQPGRARPAVPGAAVRGERRDDQPRGPESARRRAPRQVESRHFLGTGQWVGRRVPYHCTAVGKVLLAFGGVDWRTRRPARAAHPATIVDPAALAGELERVRRDGCATAIDELEVGLSIARRTGRRRVAALSISGPTLRLDAAAHGRAPTRL